MVASRIKRFSLGDKGPLWVFLIGMLTVFAVTGVIGYNDFHAQEKELYIDMRRVENGVTDRFRQYSSVVESVGAFYASSTNVDESEWMSFLLGMKVPQDRDIGGMAFMPYDSLKEGNACQLQNIYIAPRAFTFSSDYLCSQRKHMHDEILKRSNEGRQTFIVTDTKNDAVLVFHPINKIGLSGVAVLSVQLNSFFSNLPLKSYVNTVRFYDPGIISGEKDLFYRCIHGDENECRIENNLLHLSFEDIFYISGHDWHIDAYMHYVPAIFTLSVFILGQLINFLTFAFLRSQQQLRLAAEMTAERTMRALKANEQRYQLAIDGTNDGIWDWDLLSNEVWYSDHWKAMLGIAKDETSSLIMFFERVHPEDKELVERLLDKHLKEKQPYDISIRMLHADGEYRWIRSRGEAVRQDDAAVRMIGSHTDITAEKEYAIQAEQFRSIVENSLELVSLINLNGTLEYMNQAGLDIIGFTNLEDARGINVSLFHTPDSQLQCENEVFPALERQGFWRGKSHFRNRVTGEVVVTDQSFFTVRDKTTGKELFYASSARDITENIIAQREVDKQKAFMEKIIEALPVGMFAKDAKNDNRVMMWNKKMEEILGFDAQSIIGKRDADFFDDPALVASIESMDKDVLDSGQIIEVMENIPNVDGSTKTVHTFKLPFYDDFGEAENIIGILVDTTKQIQTGKELVKAKEEADTANIAKSEFLANMSHEIRTPLNGVIGMCDLMERSELNAKQQKFMSVMKTSSHNLLDIVNDILDISKLEAGQFNLEIIPVQPRPLCSDIVETHRAKAKEKGLELILDVAKEVPKHIMGDPTRIAQVLNNLLSNSIKFTDSGSVSLHVSSRVVGNHVHEIQMDVVDTGIGIGEEKLALVFDKFTQADSSTTRKFGGTGLGLSIVKEIVEKMGGTITVTSSEGKGTTFSATFTADATNEDGDELIAPSDVDTDNALSSMNILVAEDNPTNQQVIEWMLEDLGCNFTICENGEEALKELHIAKSRYHAVLMDCQMPVLDGYETTKAIRASTEAFAEIPIIAVTANAMEGDREKCIEVGMNDYISKPIDESKLISLLKQTMN